MTNQKTLDTINEILATAEADKIAIVFAMLKELKLKLIEDIEISEAKGNGKDNVLKGFKYILKNTENSEAHANLHKVFKYGNNYVVSDAHNLLMYSGELNFKETSNPEKCPEFMMNVLKSFPNEQAQIDNQFIKIDMPSKATVKNVISEQKAYNKLHNLKKKAEQPKPIYQIKEDRVKVNINAEYLLNLINIGITELYCKEFMFYGFNPDKSIKGIVCGIRKEQGRKR